MSKTLLLADDSATIQRVVELTFAQEDVRVVSVGDGEQAVRLIDRDRPDIVLADVGMPELDGYAVSTHVKQSPHLRNIPVLLLTGAFEPIDEERARRAACDGILIKPFEPRHLVARVLELLAPGAVIAAPHDAAAQAPAAVPASPTAMAEMFPERAATVSLDLPALDSGLSWADSVKPIEPSITQTDRQEAGTFELASAQPWASPVPAFSPAEPRAPLTAADAPPPLAHADLSLVGGGAQETLEPPTVPIWNLKSMSSVPSRESDEPPVAGPREVPAGGAHFSDDHSSPIPSVPAPAISAPVEPASAPEPVSSAPVHAAPAPEPEEPSPAPEAPAPRAAAAPAQTAPPVPAAPAPAPAAPISLASAFSALLAAEQAHPPPAVSARVTISEAEIEDVIRRVVVRVTDEVVRRVVQDAAERLIREEIDKIKSASDGL